MKPWVLVDVSYLAHRARYALKGMDWEDLPTGIIYGFLEQIRALCSEPHINSNKLILCFDSRQSYRRRAFSDYKRKRREGLTEDDRRQLSVMHDQVELLRTLILPNSGFRTHRQTGCESDDLMAMAALQLSNRSQPGVIVTADGDLWQCLSDTVHWYDPARKVYHTPQSFKKKKGIEADQWGVVKAWAGCAGDGVPGVPGVGEKTAIQHLNGTLPPSYKRAKAITSDEGKCVYERNRGLVILPHKKTNPFDLIKPDYNTKAFFKSCERYGILSYLKEPKKSMWEKFFSNNGRKTRKRGGLLNG